LPLANFERFYLRLALIGILMEELHTDSIDGATRPTMGLGHVPGRGRTPTSIIISASDSVNNIFIFDYAISNDKLKRPVTDNLRSRIYYHKC
jgi:hypothetical protein